MGFPVTRCPNRTITREIVEISRAYAMMQNGTLAVSGGWLDQCHTGLKACDIFGAAFNDSREEQAKRED